MLTLSMELGWAVNMEGCYVLRDGVMVPAGMVQVILQPPSRTRRRGLFFGVHAAPEIDLARVDQDGKHIPHRKEKAPL